MAESVEQGARSSEFGRVSKSTKHPAPRSVLQTAEIIGILHKWGIHTLGQLAALDKEELRNRLGSEAVQLWERANGTATRLLKFVQPPESFDESFEFDHEIETAEPLLFILRRFLEQLALRLSSIYLVARELTLTITFSNSHQVRYETDSSDCRDGPAATGKYDGRRPPLQAGSYEHVFKIPQPTNDVDLLFRMLQTHLENFKSEHAIVGVGLRAEPSRPASQQFGLFETALRNPHQLYETLARLAALVGNDRVGTPVLEETHRPDAFRMEAFSWHGLPAHVSSARMPMPRPALRRFRPPARTSIFISEGKYLSGDWQHSSASEYRRNACCHRRSDKIIDQAGPFLLSGNWWNEKAWARAEYDMQLENGELVRAHESGPTSQSSAPASKWAIDGIYD